MPGPEVNTDAPADETSPPASGFRSRRRRRRRGLGTAIVVVVGLAVVLVGGGSWLVRTVLRPEALADRLEPRLSAALNRPVTIGSAGIRFLPRPAVRLRSIRIGNRGVFSETPLATVDEILLEPRILPLLRRELVVDRLSVLGPRALLVVAEDGTTNYGDFVPARTAADSARRGGEAPMEIELRRITVTGGRVGWRDRADGRSAQADGLTLAGSLERGADAGLAVAGTLGLDSLAVRLPGTLARPVHGVPVRLVFDAVVAPSFAGIEIRRGELEVAGVPASLTGRIDSLKTPVRRVDLAARAEHVPLGEIAGLRPDGGAGARVTGTLDLDLRATGAFGGGARPDLAGLFVLRGVSARAEDGTTLVRGLEGRAQLAADSLGLDLRGEAAGGDVSISGRVGLTGGLPVDLRLRAAPDLAALPALRSDRTGGGGGSRVALRGRMRLDTRVTGPAGRPDRLRFDGSLGLEGVEATGGRLAVPFTVPSGSVRLAGRSATWSGLAVRVGSDRLVLTGRIDDPLASLGEGDAVPVLDAEVQGPRLDLDAALGARAAGEIGWGRLAFAHLGDRRIEGRSAEAIAADRALRRPARLPLRGDMRVRLDSLIYAPYRLSAVRGALALSPESIEMTRLDFGGYGGTGTARLSLDLAGRGDAPFRLEMALRDVRAADWLAQNTPLGRAVEGTMGLDLTLEGGLDSLLLPDPATLTGRGESRIRNGAIEPNPVTRALASFLKEPSLENPRLDSWISPFTIGDGRVRLADATLELARAAARLTGAVGFGGALDMGMLLRPDSTLARSLAASAGGALGDLVGRLTRSDGAAALAFAIGGQLGRPSVSLATPEVQNALESAAREAAGEAAAGAQEQIRRQGRELLQGLLGGAARDSARRDTAGPAAARTDSAAAADTTSSATRDTTTSASPDSTTAGPGPDAPGA